VAAGTDKLCAAARWDEMEADIVGFPEGTDLEKYLKPY
jgi:hypothetical protein